VPQGFTIAKANQTITFGSLANKTTAQSPVTVSATASSGLTVSFSSLTTPVCTVSGTTVTLVAPGTCTIRASQGGDANWNAATPVDQSFTVTNAVSPQSITFGPLANKVYGDPAFTVSATGGASGNPVTFTTTTPATCSASGVNGSTISISGAGSCTVQANQAGNASYSAAPPVNQSFTITKAALTVTAAPQSKVYGSANPTLTVGYSGFVYGQTLGTSGVTGTPSCSTTATASSAVATYPITCVVGTLASGNYSFTFVNGSLSVTKAPLTVTADDKTKVQGSPNSALTATLSGFVLGQTLGTSGVTGSANCTTTATTGSAAGTYPITCTLGTLTATNYSFGPFVAGTMTVTSSNTPPTITNIANQSTNEDTATGAIPFTVGDAQTAPGSLVVSGSSSNTAVVPNGNIVFGGSGANRTVTITPVANQFGASTITVTVTDAGSLTATSAFTLTVNSVNDVPSFTKGANQTVARNAGAQSVSGWATAISAGPANESGQAVNFIVSNNNNALFSVQPTVSAAGTLTYTPNPASSGTATVSVQIHDNGGTANGGVDTNAVQTFTITTTVPNTPPTITNIANQSTNEDTATGAIAFTVGDSQTAPGSLVVSGSSSNTAVVPNGNIVFGGSGANRTLTITPVANQFGASTITVTVTDAGSLTATSAFTLTVNSVNDVPSFTKGADQSVPVNSGAQSVSGWATAISAGPANESGQAVNFIVTNNNNALFSTQPAVSPSGTLTYQSALNATGSATVSVRVHDNGGTANGGVDTSGIQTFTITVLPTTPKLVFTTPPRTINRFTLSGLITIQRQSFGGSPLTTGPLTVNLSTTGAGVFVNAAGTAFIGSVTIPAGSSSASFRYLPLSGGNKTIIVSASGYTSASQVEIVP
jgi:D-arabinose 5-phosphate isomerase GutQ